MKKFEEIIRKPIILTLLLVIFIMGGFSYVVINNVVNQKFHQLFQTILVSKQNEIESFFYEKDQELQRIENLYRPDQTISQNLNKIRDFNQITKTYESLGIVDQQGEIYLTTQIQFNIKNRDYYQKLINSKQSMIISDLVDSKENDEKIVILLRKLPDGRMLSGALNIQYINQVLTKTDAFHYTIQIVSSNQQVIMESDENTSNSIIYETPLKQKENWKLKIYVPTSFFSTTLTIINLASLLVCLFSYFFIRKIIIHQTRKSLLPLELLSQKMTDKNQSFKQIESHSKIEEIKSLENSYNQQMQTINQLILQVENETNARKDSDYQALLEQVKPHFLYNTLETIQAMTLDYDDRRLEQAISLLGKYFRLSLSGEGKTITLKNECELITIYLQLQQLRKKETLKFEINNQGDLEFKILRFTIQPLIENAIHYGVHNLSNEIEIKLNITQNEKGLTIQVINTFEGDPQEIETLNQSLKMESQTNHGLTNVSQRLKLHFKQNCLSLKVIDNHVCATIYYPDRREDV